LRAAIGGNHLSFVVRKLRHIRDGAAVILVDRIAGFDRNSLAALGTRFVASRSSRRSDRGAECSPESAASVHPSASSLRRGWANAAQESDCEFEIAALINVSDLMKAPAYFGVLPFFGQEYC
jgi:hypothetical protein